MSIEDRMSTTAKKAWEKHHKSVGRVYGAVAVALELSQPALAVARKVTLAELRASGETFAALERVLMANGKTEEQLEDMHHAYWAWAVAQLALVMA